MLIGRKTEIALIFLACSICAYFYFIGVVARPLLSGLKLRTLLGHFYFFAMLYTPVSVLTIVGLTLYVAERKELKKHASKYRNLLTLSKYLGAVLLVSAAHAFMMGDIRVYVNMGWAGVVLIINSPATFSSVLWVISGIILIVDSWRDLS